MMDMSNKQKISSFSLVSGMSNEASFPNQRQDVNFSLGLAAVLSLAAFGHTS
jgi:hypothetical protein